MSIELGPDTTEESNGAPRVRRTTHPYLRAVDRVLAEMEQVEPSLHTWALDLLNRLFGPKVA